MTGPTDTKKRLLVMAAVVTSLLGAVWLFNKLNQQGLQATGDDRVVAVLGSNQNGSNQTTPYPAELRAAARQVRDHPQDRKIVLNSVRLYIRHGRALGDSRLVSAALAVLRPWQDADPDAEILDLLATARQYQHDFNGALTLLDRAIALQPDAANPLLTRANILVVQGRFPEASADCSRLARARRLDITLICDTTAKALTADATVAYERLHRISQIHGAIDPDLQAYASELLGEVAMFRGWTDKALLDLKEATRLAPEDLRAMMVYADLMLQMGGDQDAITLMAQAPATDGILVRRATAYKALKDATHLEPVRLELARRFEQQKLLGVDEHAREAARFQLEIAGDARLALERATANWKFQREFEDAQLFLDAAAAGGSPESAIPVIEWMREQKVDAPALRIPASLKSMLMGHNAP